MRVKNHYRFELTFKKRLVYFPVIFYFEKFCTYVLILLDTLWVESDEIKYVIQLPPSKPGPWNCNLLSIFNFSVLFYCLKVSPFSQCKLHLKFVILQSFSPYTFLSWVFLKNPENSLPDTSKQIGALEVVSEDVGLFFALISQVLYFPSVF